MSEFDPTTNETWIKATGAFTVTMLIVAAIYILSQIFM